MHKEDFSGTLFALMAGATVGAGIGLLFAPQTGLQFRSSLRDLTRTAKDQVDRADQDSTQSNVRHDAIDETGIRTPDADVGARPVQKDHTLGDTGQDN